MKLPNPLIPGFNPDPSVVRVGDDYFLVTSTFEYLPGLPVYHSTDLCRWALIGHVVTRPEQFDAGHAPTGGGLWAPTIRWHGGRFHVIVAAMGMGTRVYTADDAAGPWSDGIRLDGIDGIDPDLAWDGDGTCYVTYSGLVLGGEHTGTHLGIQQARVDLAAGAVLEAPRSMWSGTGLMFPEAPHLYRIGDWWYLMIAEGGTERGHCVSIARARTPDGPFEGCPANPVLSARSTVRPIQNTGHGDLVEAPDGSWSMVLLGMRTRGLTRSFSALGRETFGTHVEWHDGWPVVDPVVADDEPFRPTFVDDFAGPSLDAEWVGVRRMPSTVGTLDGDALVLAGEGRSMAHPEPTFVGRRQRRHDARIATVVLDPSTGVGGLTVRYDEHHHYDVEVGGGRVTGRAVLPSLRQERTVDLAADLAARPVELALEMHPVEASFATVDVAAMDLGSRMSCDEVHLVAVDAAGVRHELARFDGRYLSAESACSFTGRVAGLYCESGTLRFDHYREDAL